MDRPFQWQTDGTVKAELSGKRYKGDWVVENGLVTVFFEEVPPQTTHYSYYPEATAHMLLSEMVNAYLSGDRGKQNSEQEVNQ